ncbi:MAG: copper resistance system multicopper oxidase [Halioglobus sp.]|nr:copper resistance system multicopper oxidase [Halioglobus sp.]
MQSRRQFIHQTTAALALGGVQALLPPWARSNAPLGDPPASALSGTEFQLAIARSPLTIDGQSANAITVNGTLPAPLLRWREGDTVTLDVSNHLDEDTSIHWHGILLPVEMDGVPGLSFAGIRPGETFRYRFTLKQAGTYWYHSHSNLQEQLGHYGPLIIDPAEPDPVGYDREHVLVLSDWTFLDPHVLFGKLKKMSDSLNYQKRTLGDFIDDAREQGFTQALADRAMWGAMRMSPTDIADVTGATYTYLVNGHAPAANWTGLFQPGERVRLRIINASAMSFFNVRIPGLAMTVVQADGLNVEPLEIDEFQIGVAETYDVIVRPDAARAYTVMCESIDGSGYARATLAPRPGMQASVPELRPRPLLSMRDMGMSHAAHSEHAMHAGHAMPETPPQAHPHPVGPGVANVAENPVSRLHEPGIGLENVAHRALAYSMLRSLAPNPDQRPPGREMELHLTSNMERYMWSFDGVQFSAVVEPIVFHLGERLRLTLVNDTMMPHPIHLHGMFFQLVNGGGAHQPNKHTIIVKPAEKLAIDITADAPGDWAFHCHLLYHMHAGMFQVVSVREQEVVS